MAPRALLFGLLSLLALALIGPATAAAEGTPNIGLTKQAPETALIGTNQRVTLTASNPKGEKRGYNLTFRDVLDPGVVYVPGSSPVAPTILKDAPVAGKTTLIFENVADLSGNSEYKLSFEVEPRTPEFALTGKATYKDVADAFVSREPRIKPRFGLKGEIVIGTFNGTAHAEAETRLTAVEIEKSEPSPEGEIMRGVHEHQTVYTLTLRNNKVGPTKELAVDDYLPAGLEFLGCGTTDNTTDTKTNPGSAEEYPGSGPIDPGNAPAAPLCREPDLVKTEEVDPPGKQPLGIYTHIRWEGLGELKPTAGADELQIQYIAAIPILKNALFPAGTEPAPAGLGQIANLDNNTGAETVDEESLTNSARVEGAYEGTLPVEDRDEMTRSSEDLAVQKTVDKAAIADGQISTWSLHIESSEYRYVNEVSIKDLLPNGLCPLGAQNYEGPSGGVIEPKAECDPTGVAPEVEVVGGGKEAAEYTSAEEQSNGTFQLGWDKSTVPALGHMTPSEELVLTFPTRNRVDYQSEFKDSTPVLTGDSWTNSVDIAGNDFARCAPADPNCTGAGTKIFTEETEGTPDLDHSAASQQAGGVAIDKTVRENEGLVPADCSGNYVQGTAPPLPLYGPGDKVCWTLRVNFASELFAGAPVVTDFLPPDEQYVPGSAAPTANNTVESEFKGGGEGEEGSATPGTLEWTLGESVESGEKVFEWRFATIVQKALENGPEDITGNLMKFVYANTEGETFPLRDRAEVERQEPELKLLKGVYKVNGVPAGGNPPNTDGVVVHGGDTVTYRLDLTNAGNLAAQGTEIWDRLPAGITCADVSAISPAGTCEEGRIVWQGLAVAAAETLPSLTYDVLIPEGEAPVTKYVNTAGVTHYGSETNTGEEFIYVPKENIDPEAETKFGPANTEPVGDASEVKTAAAALLKTRTTETTQGGNGTGEATIGEIVDYEVKATIPAGSAVFGSPTLSDAVGPRLEYIAGSATATVNGTAVPTGGFTVGETANSATVSFPATYENAAGSGDDVVILKFKARVANVAANFRGAAAVPNTGKFTYQDQTAVSKTLESSANTALVEPKLIDSKSQSSAPKGIVEPGQEVQYTVSTKAESGAGFSAANEVQMVDTVPPGMTPVALGGGTYVANGPGQGGTITWALGLIEPGQTVSRTYTLEVENPANSGSTFANKVTSTTQSLADVAGNPPTGTRTAGFEEGAYKAGPAGYESSATASVQLIDATTGKSVSPETGTIGTPLTYTLTLKLPPSVKFFNTTVEDQLPNGVVYDGAGKATIECVGGCGLTGNELPAIEPNGEGGTSLGWYFGNIEAATEEREIKIVYPAHIADEYNGGALVKAGDSLVNKVTGYYNGSDKGEPTEIPAPGSFESATNTGEATTEVLEPKLGIDKSVTIAPAGGKGPPATQPDDTYTYKLLVTNNGTSDAWDTVVEDNNPRAGLRNVVAVAGAGFFKPRPAGEPLLWEIHGPIEPGETVELTYTAELAPSGELSQGEEILNTADVPLYFGIPLEKQEPGVEYREYTEDPEDTAALEVELPQIKVEKTTGATGLPDEAIAQIGKPFPWRIFVSNESKTATAKGVDIVDTLPEGWEFIAGSAEFTPAVGAPNPVVTTVGGKPTLTWQNVTDLGPSKSLEVVFKAKPTTALINAPGIYTNSALATAEDLSGATGSSEGPYEGSDTAKANLQVPGLNIVKTPDEGRAVAGEESAYSIEIVNSGEAVATEVEVTDVLGAGNQYTAGSATATPPTGFEETAVEAGPGAGETTVKWKIASIHGTEGIPGNGGTVTINVPVKLAPTLADGAKLVDVAAVKSAEQVTPKEDDGSLKIAREADVSIEKTANPATVVAGEELDYTLTVANNGPSEASNVVVTDPLPEGTKFVSAGAPCVEAAGIVECALGELPLGFSQSYHVHVQVLPGTTSAIVNKAEVTTTTEDPVESNNTAEVTTPVEPEADVAIVKSGPTAPVLLGGTFTYTLEVENKGPSDAAAVSVGDPLPPQVELVPGGVTTDTGTCTEVAPLVECALGTMVPGAKATIHVTVKAAETAPASEPVENFATAESPTTPDPELGNNESSAKTTVLPAADLAIQKTAPASVAAGGQVTYRLHVENLGPSDATGVAVTDPLPAGTVFVSASEGCKASSGIVICALVELGAGEARNFQVVVTVPLALAGQALANTATVAGNEADPNTTNDSSTAPTQVGPAADLEIVKTMGAAHAGQSLTYTLAVTNHGPSQSSAVTVHDALPAGVSFTSAQPSQGSCAAAGAAVTCQLGPLAAGASAQVTITVQVAASTTGALRNVASVEGPEPDPNHANNESAVEGPVGPPLASAPNLHVVKTADESRPEVGKPFHYKVTVTNRGTVAAKNVRVTDTLNGPAKIETIVPDKGTCKAAAGGKFSCLIPSLAPHAAAHIGVTVVAERAGELTNEASAMAGNGEVSPADNHAVKDVKAVAAPASYTLTKTASSKVVPGGKTVGFTIALRNRATALTNVSVCDRLPAGLVFVKAPGASFVKGAACWQRPFVAAGATLKLHLVARAVRGYKTLRARNVATAEAGNAPSRKAGVTVRIKPAFGGKPGGVTG